MRKNNNVISSLSSDSEIDDGIYDIMSNDISNILSGNQSKFDKLNLLCDAVKNARVAMWFLHKEKTEELETKKTNI